MEDCRNETGTRVIGYVGPANESDADTVRKACGRIAADPLVVVESNDDRSDLKSLLANLEEGDLLVTATLADFGDKLSPITAVLRRLARAGVRLQTVRRLNRLALIDATPDQVGGLADLLAFADSLTRKQTSEATKRGLEKRRKAGQVAHRSIPFGHSRRNVRGRKVDEWSESECAVLREIRNRLDSGETYDAIARDFWRRNLRRPDGSRWAYRRAGRFSKPSTRRLKNAMAFLRRLERNGIGPMGEPLTPEARTLHDQDPAAWELHVRTIVRNRQS